jgi:hypothetical protein
MADSHESRNNEPASALDIAGIAKYSAVLAAFTYSMGALAINTYLHQLGITDFAFAKPKLLLTGILVVSSFALLAAPLFFLIWKCVGRSVPGWNELPSFKELLSLVLACGALLAICCGYFCFTRPAMGQISVWWIHEQIERSDLFTHCLETAIIFAENYLPVLMAAFCAFQAARSLFVRKQKGLRRRISFENFHLAMAILFAVIFTLVYIYSFALTFYPVVPQAFGGGQPYFESFAIAPGQQCPLEQIGVPFDPLRQNVTMPLPVMHESDALVAVWLNAVSAEESAAGSSAARPAETGTAGTHAETMNAGEENAPQQGLKRFVVQIEKTQINATMEYSSDTAWPKISEPPKPCKTAASQ